MFLTATGDLNNNLGAIITIISALAAAIVSVSNAIQSHRTKKRVDTVDGKLATADGKLDDIKRNTNGDRDRLLAEIGRRDLTIKMQRERMDQQDQTIANKDAQLEALGNKRRV